jgi:hypothetical protein
MRSLDSVLVTEYGGDLNGWKLSVAEGISADGRTIAGYGINPAGQNDSWIVTIPEPVFGCPTVIVTVVACRGRRKEQSHH